MTLSSGLALAIERREEKEIESYFYFELALYPASLLKEGVLRPAANKNTVIRTCLLKLLEAVTFVKDESMADEGALLWSVNGAGMKP